MSFDEAVQLYQRINPGVDLTTPEGQDAFNQFSASIGHFENVPADDAAVAWANANPNDPRLDDPAFLQSVGLEPDVSPPMPVEQALMNEVINRANTDIAGDAQRRIEGDQIISNFAPALDGARQTVADIYQTVDAAAYFRDNPDVAAFYQNAVANGQTTETPEQFVLAHYNNYGRFEGRTNPSASNLLRQQTDASNQAAAQQLTALNTQLSSLQSNLNGELAAKAGNLQTQLNTLSQGIATFSDEQKRGLAAQLAENFRNLEAEIGARRTSLTTALAQMQGAIGAEAESRKAALAAELTALQAAQVPVNELRERGAQTLATAINVGLQSTKDNITAKAAQDGYIGSSTGTDMAMTRATIGARQGAAQAIAGAKLENAQDNALISRYGATEGRRISDQLAAGTREIAGYGATEGRSISDFGAAGQRTLGDYGAGETRNIGDMISKSRLDLTAFGAGANRELSDAGATGTRAIGDFGASEKRGIADAAASRGLGYFDQDISRRLAALSLPSAAVGTELGLRKSVDDYANSGLDRTMKNLSFFNINTGTPPSAQPFTTRPIDSGMEKIGAGLISVAGNIASANNWWAPSKKSPGATGKDGDGYTNPFSGD